MKTFERNEKKAKGNRKYSKRGSFRERIVDGRTDVESIGLDCFHSPLIKFFCPPYNPFV